MIAGLKIRNFKGIKRSPLIALDRFQVLVGPNGSGKSTFLDTIEFVKDCISDGLLKAVEKRAPEFRDLTFLRQGGPIELEFHFRLDEDDLQYRLTFAEDGSAGARVVQELLHRPASNTHSQIRIMGKTSSGKDFYKRESGRSVDYYQFGPDRLALSQTPRDLQRYPAANAVKDFLAQGVRYLQLNSAAMRQPAQATRPTELDLDGSNLARVVGSLLRNGDPTATPGRSALERWTAHLRYAIEDLESIGWGARTPDNAEYLVLKLKGGLECPNWLLSDGTLRMLALTLPAFLPGKPGLYMVEEPENGVHPHALEIIIGALAAIPRAQVFLATHSPMVLQQVGVAPLLCFAKNERQGVTILHGDKHPALRDWQGTPDLGSIFPSRVLG